MTQSRPVEPDRSCRDLEAVFAAYVDGEAASCDCDQVRAHVEQCAGCRDRLRGERAAREAIRARRSVLRSGAPEPLKARCAAYAQQGAAGDVTSWRPARPRSRAGRVLLRWAPVSVAATLLLAVATVFGFGLNDKAQALAFQTTIDHIKCTRFSPNATAVSVEDAERQFGWAIAVPGSSPDDRLELRGVRRCSVLDGRVAHVMYTWNGEPFSVYVLPKRTVGETAQVVQRFQHNSIMWSRNDRTYIMVTPHRRDPALDAMVAYVRATAY